MGQSDIMPAGENVLMDMSAAELSEQMGSGRKVLRIDKRKNGAEFKGTLAQILEYINIGHALAHIEKAKQYIVQIPLEYQKAFNEGVYFINQNKTTGVHWPQLMEIKPNGRYSFVDSLPIVEQGLIKGNPLRDISMNFYNIALQQQIAAIADAVERTYKLVERIEHGQMDDRIAGLYSGREQIKLALMLKDPVEKKRAIALGRQSLIDAKYKLGITLKRRIEEFKPLPDGWWAQRWLVFRHKDILNRRDDEVQEIQDYYELFLEATKLIAFSYIQIDEKDTATRAFVDSIDFMKTINFENLHTIRFIHKKNYIQEMFMYHPVAYIEAEQQQAEEDGKEYDYMLVEVSGEELLEVLKDGKEVRK